MTMSEVAGVLQAEVLVKGDGMLRRVDMSWRRI
jgi:hypothetical protein